MASKFLNSIRLLTRLRGILAAAVLVSLGGFVGVAHAGYAAIVVDAQSGQVLNEVNADEPNHPASLTKMMTLYIAFQELRSGKLKLDQELPVSAHAADKAPTKLGLRRNETISVQDCILGIVTKSANDAATVLAEGIGGSEDHFVDMMNAQALLLGMTNTHFDNASGLPGRDASTARDLAKLSMALYRDFPQDTPYFATREFTFRGKVVHGHNRLMDRYPGMDGLKTGYTAAAGFNLASTAVRDGHRLFGVVMGGRTAAIRDNLMARLLDDSFDHQQTPDTLVAQAGIDRPSSASRVLAALSPIKSAAADTLPASSHRRNRSTRKRVVLAAATTTCSGRKGKTKACAQARVTARATTRSAATRLARNSKKPASRSVGAKTSQLAQRKHTAHPTRTEQPQVAHRNGKKSIVVASRSHDRG